MSTTSETADAEATTAPAPDTRNVPQPPVAGEEIHLPGPSLIPLITAVAITMIVVGTTIDWLYSIIGVVVLIVAVVKWIMDTRRDVAELPEEHEGH